MPENAPKVRDYRDLIVWQRARALVRRVYDATKAFPGEETFGLAHQLRRSVISVPSNIAEGYGRGTRKDYVRFLQMARGSLYEVQTQLLLAQDLGYLTTGQVGTVWSETEDCSRLMQGLLRSLKPRPTRTTRAAEGRSGG